MDVSRFDRWSQIQSIFEQAIELETVERASFVESTCSSDPELQREVERLLAAHDSAAGFLSSLDPAKSAALIDTASAEAVVPDVIGRYRIVRRIGSGATGLVYLAHDPQLDRHVALKVLRTRYAVSGSAHRRLLEEARAASALDHPNVAAIYEIGETDDGWPFIAMGYCEGESLANVIARGPLPVRTAVQIAQQITAALAAAHALGIVHRDVKPANIVVSREDRVRLMDFGVASVVGRDVQGGRLVAGTPAYMSPEQSCGEDVAPATDVWALGVVLYEMLTGRRPFQGDTRERLRKVLLQNTPTPVRQLRPEVPVAINRIVERCLSKNPADRPKAAELSAALATSVSMHGRVLPRRRVQVIAVVTVLTLLLIGFLVRRADRAAAFANAELVVLPFTPVVSDSALERVGWELVITIGASLDGVAGLRVVEPIAVLGQRSVVTGATLTELAGVARRMGASSMLHGRLARTAAGIRLDATIYKVNDLTVMARASTESSVNDLSAMTDSVTLALLRTAWRGRAGPAPNLAAITTHSLPALRAYLDGELAIAAGQFRSAPAAFERAIQADSTFWFAYWRYMYAQNYHGNPVDSAISAKVFAHRSEFPEPDRMLIEAQLLKGQRSRLELRRSITLRNPMYWPAFFELGDQLMHHGPFLGEPAEEASIALRRTTELNPNFVPAWAHLFWLTTLAHDTIESARVLAKLAALRLDTLLRDEWSHQPLDYYQYLLDLSRSKGNPSTAKTALGARLLASADVPSDPERLATTLTNYGFHRAQLDLSRGVISQRPRARVSAAHVWGQALAWAGRGDWDSTFVAARQYARATTHPSGALWAFGLVTTGVWLGAVHPDSALVLRAAALRSEQGSSPGGAAEIAWLDGLIACARGDHAALKRQHVLLRASAASGAPALARSLAAFAEALAGRRIEAGHALSALELENADAGWQFRNGPLHPFVVGVNRIAAARMLLATGDTVSASRLLLLHEVDLPQSLHPLPTVSFVLGTYALAGLARVEQARGYADRARRYRDLFQQRVDRAPRLDVLAGTPVCGTPGSGKP